MNTNDDMKSQIGGDFHPSTIMDELVNKNRPQTVDGCIKEWCLDTTAHGFLNIGIM